MDEKHDKVIFIDKTVAVSWGKLMSDIMQWYSLRWNLKQQGVPESDGEDARCVTTALLPNL